MGTHIRNDRARGEAAPLGMVLAGLLAGPGAASGRRKARSGATHRTGARVNGGAKVGHSAA